MKKRLTKRILGIMLVVALFLGMVPVSKKAEAADINLNIWVFGYKVTTAELNSHLKGFVSYDPDKRELYFITNAFTNYIGLSLNMGANPPEALIIIKEKNITLTGCLTYPFSTNYGLYSDYSVNINGIFNFTGMEMGIVANGDVNILGGCVQATGAATDKPSYGIYTTGMDINGNEEIQAVKTYPGVTYVIAESCSTGENDGAAIVTDKLDMTDSSGKDVMKILEPEDAFLSPYYRTIINSDDTPSVAKKATILPYEGKDYDLWLGKKRVTESNCNDVFGDGKAKYEPSTNTLTLNEPVLNGSFNPGNTGRYYKIYSGLDDLTIKGNYHMKSATSFGGIYAGGNLTLDGDFDLKAKGYGIISGKADNSITVKGSSLKIACSLDSPDSSVTTIGIYALNSTINIEQGVNVDITCKGTDYRYPIFYKKLNLKLNQVITIPSKHKEGQDQNTGNYVILDSSGNMIDHLCFEYEDPGERYEIYLGSTQVTNKNYKDIFGDGKASYDPVRNILTLDDPDISGSSYFEEEGEQKRYKIMALNDLTIKGSYKMRDSETSDYEVGIMSLKDLTIDGSFTFVGKYSGIVSEGNLTVKSGANYVKCLNNNNRERAAGIMVNKNMTMEDGYLSVECDYTGETKDSSTKLGLVATGDVNINGGNIDISCKGDNGTVKAYGITSIGNFTMNGGSMSVKNDYTGQGDVTGAKYAVYSFGKAEFNGGKSEMICKSYRALKSDVSLTINEKAENVRFVGNPSVGIVLAPAITVSDNLKSTVPDNYAIANSDNGYTFVNIENNEPVLVPEVSLELKYPIWVGDTLVTEKNKNDIFGDGGRAKYDPATNTLTLDNPVINGSCQSSKIFTKEDLVIAGEYHMPETEVGFGVFSVKGLTLRGNFTFKGRTGGIMAFNRATIASGSLIATGGNWGIEANDIIFENGIEKVELDGGTSYAAYATMSNDKSCDGIVMGSDLEITEPKNLYIKGDDSRWSIYYTPYGYETTAPKATIEHRVDIGSLDGDGTENKPYMIKSTDDWNLLSRYVERGNPTSEMYFELANDIAVLRSVGTSENPFGGIFNGNDHVLNVSLSGSEADICVAPFSHISNSYIKALKVMGIVTGGRHSSGLIGGIGDGPNLIENCEVGAIITALDYYCGGMLGHGGSVAATVFENCVFSGTIYGADHAGTIWGWSDEGCRPELINCIDVSDGTFPIGIGNPNGPSVINTYYINDTKDIDSSRPWKDESNGKLAHKITCEGNEMTLIGNVGVMYNSAIYAAAGDEVIFTVKGSNSILTSINCEVLKDGDNWKLIMPARDVTIRDLSSTPVPTAKPTATATVKPTATPAVKPTAIPTDNPTTAPADPTQVPGETQTTAPADPTQVPGGVPTAVPGDPTQVPGGVPTTAPHATPVTTVTTDSKGSTITKTESTNANGAKITQTVVDKKDGSSEKTTDVTKQDGSTIHEEITTKKSGKQTINTVKTDASGNKTVTNQQVKPSGDYTSTVAKISVDNSGKGKKTENLSSVQVSKKENGSTTKEYYVPDSMGKNSIKLKKVDIAEDKKGKSKNITVVIAKTVKINGVSYKVTTLKTRLFKKNAKSIKTVLIKASGLIKIEKNTFRGLSSNVVIKIKATLKKFKKIRQLIIDSGIDKNIVIKRA